MQYVMLDGASSYCTQKANFGDSMLGGLLNLLYCPPELFWSGAMSKEQKSNKEAKKKPAMTPKEKKAAKKSRKESRDSMGTDRTR
jgi:hypothetical protein